MPAARPVSVTFVYYEGGQCQAAWCIGCRVHPKSAGSVVWRARKTMFLGKDRPLALFLQLGGIGLLAYDLVVSEPQVSGGAAAAGLAVFVVGTLLSRVRM